MKAVRLRLLAWYGEAKRDLPWRVDRDPYRILVSEVMLVQTTVTAVIPYFERFLRAFPDFEALARAEEDEVVKAWEGLGYYRRARQLHAAARMVVESHGGVMPDDPAAVLALPGVGRYMAGAILSQAFDRPEPILEANSQRVLARLLAWDGDLKAAATKSRLWEAAARLVPPRHAGEFNQGLMELGALVCTSRSPRCLVCPLSAQCEAKRRGLQDELPKVGPRPAPLAVSEACAVVASQGRVLVVRRQAPGLWAGFWEFPTIHREGADPAGRSFGEPVDLAEGVRRLTGIRVRSGGLARTLTYSVTKHRVALEVYNATATTGEPKPGPGFSEARWIEPQGLTELTLSSAGRRLASAVAENPAAWGLE
ncbi:A/G-specific adenine glycosylase [Paludisphaera borealis]|uniref:Adenine DNA glycosylase n=1 Tax=Paludisphaera borealis TaxID=1387353 RepID=A0A1U7CTV5_9BACT|nr:A/G-specific adenine glycosylase [Paludisphaera borealis]APW62377.1 putative A/G-specific adenine glycosylase YfhQ [Paludisphaera borealis]